MQHIDEHHSGQEIQIRPGDMFELCLSENRTTGFRWGLDCDGSPSCTLIEDRFEPSSRLPGAAGIHRWQFQAARVGQGHIELSSRRPWESQGAAARTFVVRIRVEA